MKFCDYCGNGYEPKQNGSGSIPNTAHGSGGRKTRLFTPTRRMALKCSEPLSASSAGRRSRWFPQETTGHSSAAISTKESTGATITSDTTQVEPERHRA